MGGYIRPADYAGMQLGDFLEERVKALLQPETPTRLHHYTTAEGIRGILESGVLRSGPLDRLNDLAEARFAVSIFRATLDRAYAVEGPGSFRYVLAAMRRDLDIGLDLRNVNSVSFHRNGNDPTMWGLYANQGTGFSIGVPIELCGNWSSAPYRGQLWRVQYGEGAIAELSRLAIDRARELVLEEEKRTEKNWLDYSTEDEFARKFLAAISPMSVAFKPCVWADEQEWRWCFIGSPDYPQRLIELSLAGDSGPELALSVVTAGPNCEPRHVEEIRALLHRKAPRCELQTGQHSETVRFA